MPDIQALVRQQLIDETARLVARGGPGAFTATERVPLHYEPAEQWWWQPLGAGETFSPVAAVVAAIGYPDLPALVEDGQRVHDDWGPLPLYLHETTQGHHMALVPEAVVLDQLISVTAMVDAVMLEESTAGGG
jgi:hypothetical protein